MKEDLLKIINHYGILTQLKYFYTEIYELTEAIIISEDEKEIDEHEGVGYNEELAKEHIAEEIADVLVMIFQFKEYYSIDDYDIEKVMHQKTKRQLDRIKKEQ